jgi:Galactose-3-O-sulfotransferase
VVFSRLSECAMSSQSFERRHLSSDAASEKPIIIFLHMPRSGGTTLNRLIEWEYGALRVFAVDGHFYRWSYNRLARLRVGQLPRMLVYQGHMPFGLHILLDAPATYMTMLREPLDRIMSEYYFRLHHSWRHPNEHRSVKTLTLEQYIRTTPRHNIQTKLLAGCHSSYDFLEDACTAETLALAKHNLTQHFGLVAISERYNESLALAKLIFGWNIRHLSNFNVNHKRPPKDTVSTTIRDLVEDRYQYDVALYQYASALFNKAIAARGSEVHAEVLKIRAARRLGTVKSLLYRSESLTRKTISRLHSAMIILSADIKLSHSRRR